MPRPCRSQMLAKCKMTGPPGASLDASRWRAQLTLCSTQSCNDINLPSFADTPTVCGTAPCVLHPTGERSAAQHAVTRCRRWGRERKGVMVQCPAAPLCACRCCAAIFGGRPVICKAQCELPSWLHRPLRSARVCCVHQLTHAPPSTAGPVIYDEINAEYVAPFDAVITDAWKVRRSSSGCGGAGRAGRHVHALTSNRLHPCLSIAG